jgi:hypothetical protein
MASVMDANMPSHQNELVMSHSSFDGEVSGVPIQQSRCMKILVCSSIAVMFGVAGIIGFLMVGQFIAQHAVPSFTSATHDHGLAKAFLPPMAKTARGHAMMHQPVKENIAEPQLPTLSVGRREALTFGLGSLAALSPLPAHASRSKLVPKSSPEATASFKAYQLSKPGEATPEFLAAEKKREEAAARIAAGGAPKKETEAETMARLGLRTMSQAMADGK